MTDSGFDLIVVGGGVFGLSTALEAGRRRRRTLVVDRRVVPNPIAASFGPSRKIRSTYLDAHYTRLALEAMATWRQIEAETGAELYVADGNLSVSNGTADAHLDELAVYARRGGAKIRWLDAADLRREYPQFRPGRRALLEEEAGFLRATDCVAALRRLAEREGVEFATGSDAAVEPVSGDVAVRTGRSTHRAPQVVVAAGGWSKRLFPELAGALWQCQQGIMYLDGVPAEFCRPAFPPYSAPSTGFYGFPAEPGRVGLKLARHLVTDPIDDPDFDRRTTPSGFVEAATEFVRSWFRLDPRRNRHGSAGRHRERPVVAPVLLRLVPRGGLAAPTALTAGVTPRPRPSAPRSPRATWRGDPRGPRRCADRGAVPRA